MRPYVCSTKIWCTLVLYCIIADTVNKPSRLIDVSHVIVCVNKVILCMIDFVNNVGWQAILAGLPLYRKSLWIEFFVFYYVYSASYPAPPRRVNKIITAVERLRLKQIEMYSSIVHAVMADEFKRQKKKKNQSQCILNITRGQRSNVGGKKNGHESYYYNTRIGKAKSSGIWSRDCADEK